MWHSAAVAHLLESLTCCAFRHVLLHTLVVTSDFLRYCDPPIRLKQPGHFPLTSGIFPLRAAAHWILSLLSFSTHLCKPTDGLCRKQTTQTSPPDTNNHAAFSHFNHLSFPLWSSASTSWFLNTLTEISFKIFNKHYRLTAFLQGQRSNLTQKVFVGAEFSGVQKELDEDVGGNNKNETNSQKSWDHTVEEQPAGHTALLSTHA